MPPDIGLRLSRLDARWDRTIDGVGADGWQRATRDRSFFLSYPWLRSAEGPLTPDPRYLTIRRPGDEDPLACVPAQRVDEGKCYFYYDLPRMLTDADAVARSALHLPASDACRLTELAQQLRERSGQMYPDLIAAASGMASDLCLRPGLDPQERHLVADRAVAALAAHADHLGAAASGFLYLGDGAAPELAGSLSAHGFSTGLVGAECLLPVAWPSFEEYLHSFSRNRRQSIEREIRRFHRAGLSIDVTDAGALGPELAVLQATLRDKYGHSSDLAAIEASYHRMRDELGPCIRVVTARRGARVVGFMLILATEDAFYARSVGFDYDTIQGDFCYFNVVFYEPIRLAIAERVPLIHYGVDSYATKTSRGCRLSSLHAAIRFAGPLSEPLREVFSLTSRANTARFAGLAGEL
jgi:predicted N-acyltransferase